MNVTCFPQRGPLCLLDTVLYKLAVKKSPTVEKQGWKTSLLFILLTRNSEKLVMELGCDQQCGEG